MPDITYYSPYRTISQEQSRGYCLCDESIIPA
jgi:hypothetical protein